MRKMEDLHLSASTVSIRLQQAPAPERCKTYSDLGLPSAVDYPFRTELAVSQFTRYGGGVENENLLNALHSLTDIHDDMMHDRETKCIDDAIDRAIGHLQQLKMSLGRAA